MAQLTVSPSAPLHLQRRAAFPPPARAWPSADGAIALRPDSASFVAMLAAFSATGGTVRADDLARLMADHQRGDYISLARMLVSGDVFSFSWRGGVWVPMFQFDSADLSVNAAARAVCAQLTQCLDGWAVAAWFATPHLALDRRLPIDLLAMDPQRVVQAARLH